MNIKRASVGLAMLGIAASASHANVRVDTDQKIRETQTTYEVTFKDGVKERVVVKYEAMLSAKVWQTGSAQKGLKLRDDRKCHYATQARVYRRAYVVTHSGVHAPVEEYQAVYDASKYGSRGPKDALQALAYHVTCGDVNNFATRITGARASLVQSFDDLVAQDDDRTRERLKKLLIGTSIRQIASPVTTKG